MAENYQFRQLSGTDVPTLKELLRVFGEAFDDVASYQHAVPSEAYLQDMLAKPHFIALVALDSKTVVGGIAAYVLDKFEQDRREIYIYDLAVLDPHRRRGVATGLIKTLRAIAAERAAYVVFVQADAGDGPAIALYESLGRREQVLHFDIDVPDRAPTK